MTAAELSAANHHRATSPAVRHSEPATTGQPAAVAIGQPAADRRRDGAHRRDRQQHQPGRPRVAVEQLLDQERYEDERAVEDDRGAHHAEDGRRERADREQARIDRRVVARELEPDEQESERDDGQRRQ